jgi:two-component system NarL family sensor kinase
MNRRPGRRGRHIGVRGELTFFYGMAALALVVVSIVAVFASRYVARTQALQDAEQMTQRLAEIVVAPTFAKVLAGDAEAKRDLNLAIVNRMADGYLTEVTVWDGNGNVLYADNPAEIGEQLDPPPEVVDAINEGVSSSDSETQPEATEQQFQGGPGFVEVYVPMDVDGLPRLAFEAYYDYARVDQAANSLLLQLVPLVLAPLLVLQLIQSPIPASLARRVRRHEEERSVLLERMLTVSDRERVRVAADLHDGPIQDLAGVTYVLDAVSPSVLEAHRPLMHDAQNTVTHAINSLRRLMVDLYPPDLSAEQLPGTVSGLADPLRERGVEVSVNVEPMVGLGNEAVTTLYRVARESLANVAAHAQASRVDIRLGEVDADAHDDDRMVRLAIIDNGVGVDFSRLDRRSEGHLGLLLLIDRVENLGGTLTVEAGPEGGTAVTATLPFATTSTIAGTSAIMEEIVDG